MKKLLFAVITGIIMIGTAGCSKLDFVRIDVMPVGNYAYFDNVQISTSGIDPVFFTYRDSFTARIVNLSTNGDLTATVSETWKRFDATTYKVLVETKTAVGMNGETTIVYTWK